MLRLHYFQFQISLNFCSIFKGETFGPSLLVMKWKSEELVGAILEDWNTKTIFQLQLPLIWMLSDHRNFREGLFCFVLPYRLILNFRGL